MTREKVYRVRAVLSKDGKTVTAYLSPMIVVKYGDHGMIGAYPEEGGPAEWLPADQVIPRDEEALAHASRIAERAKADLIEKARAGLSEALARSVEVKHL